jgi:hypothetical protein
MSAGSWPAPPVTAAEAHGVGVEAYIYLYPLVTMEITRRQMTNLPAGAKPGLAPTGEYADIREFPRAEFKAVMRGAEPFSFHRALVARSRTRPAFSMSPERHTYRSSKGQA